MYVGFVFCIMSGFTRSKEQGARSDGKQIRDMERERRDSVRYFLVIRYLTVFRVVGCWVYISYCVCCTKEKGEGVIVVFFPGCC